MICIKSPDPAVYKLANLVLMDTVEKLQSGQMYSEEPRGLMLIRGENVVLLGEIVSSILKSYTRSYAR